MRSPQCPAPPLPLRTPELGVHGIADGGGQEAVEGGAHGGGVSAHGGEDKPVTHIQLGHRHLPWQELVKGITCGTIEGTGEEGRL